MSKKRALPDMVALTLYTTNFLCSCGWLSFDRAMPFSPYPRSEMHFVRVRERVQ